MIASVTPKKKHKYLLFHLIFQFTLPFSKTRTKTTKKLSFKATNQPTNPAFIEISLVLCLTKNLVFLKSWVMGEKE